GYWCSPPLTALATYSPSQLASVNNFRVGQRDSGHQIAFAAPVDLTTLPNLGDLFGQIIVFGPKCVTVYPDESTKPALGHGLNVPATITLANIHLRDRKTQCQIVDPADPRVTPHIERLKKALAHNGGEHLSWSVTSGEWIFRVPHF
ncbi:C-terminal autoproteolytic domain of nucleoporin nup98, partial [Nadsonia fulvescens var. elongata DSM 6958]